MPRTIQQKNFFTFVKGLVSEDSFLTFRENASQAEENMQLNTDGSRQRRLGINYETSYALSSSVDREEVEDRAVVSYKWTSVANDGDLTFMVIQIGTKLYVYDVSTSATLSGQQVGSAIDMTTFLAPGVTTVGIKRIDGVPGNGNFYVFSDTTEPFYISYDTDAATLSTTQLTIEIRDFDGLDDSLDVDENPSTLSDEHNYNLLNQGWDTTKINSYQTSKSNYPANNQIWFIGKDTTDDFDPDLLDKQDFGTTPAPRGRFVINPFNIDRSGVSGVGGFTKVQSTTRPRSGAFFSSRLFFVHENKVYFSQVIEEDADAGRCYQDADPTGEHISALVKTDGGVIPITDAGTLVACRGTQDSIYVFANNGVWQIRGTSGQFSADDFQQNKISDVGVADAANVVSVEGNIMIFADDGVYTLAIDPVSQAARLQSITDDSIRGQYLTIKSTARDNAVAIYDVNDKKVYWFYNSDSSFTGITNKNRYNACFIRDLRLGAWYKYTISEIATKSPYIYGAFTTPNTINVTQEVTVVDSAGDTVIDSSSDTVVADITVAQQSTSTLKMLAIRQNSGDNDYKYTFSEFRDTTFTDWVSHDSTGVDYSSFMETGYALFQDAVRPKHAIYVVCFFKRTEENTSATAESGGFDFDEPSSCNLQAKWQWADDSTANRWTTSAEIYKFHKYYVLSGAGDFENGYPVVVTKNRIRGGGAALQLKFSSSTGKDFQLLGWAVVYEAPQHV